MKVSRQSKQFGREIGMMRKIWKKSLEPHMQQSMEAQNVAIPEMKLYGLLIDESAKNSVD